MTIKNDLNAIPRTDYRFRNECTVPSRESSLRFGEEDSTFLYIDPWWQGLGEYFAGLESGLRLSPCQCHRIPALDRYKSCIPGRVSDCPSCSCLFA